MAPLDFESQENEVLINPRMPAQQAARLRSWLTAADHLTAHVFVLTSGSTADSEADYKWIALCKQAVLAAAMGANQHLSPWGAMGEARAPLIPTEDPEAGSAQVTSNTSDPNHESRITNHDLRSPTHESRITTPDTWLHCLPDFHVGGLGIWARAYLSGAKVERYTASRWDPKEFTTTAQQAKATLSSLVPTQVYDLVQARLPAPKTLRAVIVGGAALGEDIYTKARALGWPLLPSYGMTEAASQIATAALASLDSPATHPALLVLPHLELAVEPETGRIKVRGASLLTGTIQADARGKPTFHDPKDNEGWLTTDDFGELSPGGLTVLGRVQDRIKIGGELVNLAALRRTLDEEANRLGLARSVALTAIPDARLESVIVLVYEPEADPKINELKNNFDARVMPYERIRHVRRFTKIPRTELGKIKWSELSAAVQEQ